MIGLSLNANIRHVVGLGIGQVGKWMRLPIPLAKMENEQNGLIIRIGEHKRFCRVALEQPILP